MGFGALHDEAARRVTLLSAGFLIVSGLGALSVSGDDDSRAARALAPREGTTTTASTWFDALNETTRAFGGRTIPTWVLGDYLPAPARSPSAPAPPSDPNAPGDATQVDVVVPGAGAQASAGHGEESCTTVQITALTPEGCPAPGGEGPVIVHYDAPEPEPAPENAPSGARFA